MAVYPNFRRVRRPSLRARGQILLDKIAWLAGFAIGLALFIIGARLVVQETLAKSPVTRFPIAPHSHRQPFGEEIGAIRTRGLFT